MPRNVEIKARIDAVAALQPRVAAIATEGPVEIAQDDTFFHCAHGRLKLRTFSPTRGELIFYRRDDHAGPTESFYVLTPTADPDGLREALTLAHGAAGRVVKQRTLFLVGRTRVHLDRVEGLGDFVELEVVLAAHESVADGAAEADALLARLQVAPEQRMETAYVDLLAGLAPASTA